MQSVVHSDNSRIVNWIYTRLWNCHEDGESKSTDTLIREMSGFFNLNLSQYQLEKLKKTISRIRNTTTKRFRRHERIRKQLAKEWRTDIRLVRRWDIGGLIDIQDHHSIKRLTLNFIERDYVGMVNSEIIPADIKKKIW